MTIEELCLVVTPVTSHVEHSVVKVTRRGANAAQV